MYNYKLALRNIGGGIKVCLVRFVMYTTSSAQSSRPYLPFFSEAYYYKIQTGEVAHFQIIMHYTLTLVIHPANIAEVGCVTAVPVYASLL